MPTPLAAAAAATGTALYLQPRRPINIHPSRLRRSPLRVSRSSAGMPSGVRQQQQQQQQSNTARTSCRIVRPREGAQFRLLLLQRVDDPSAPISACMLEGSNTGSTISNRMPFASNAHSFTGGTPRVASPQWAYTKMRAHPISFPFPPLRTVRGRTAVASSRIHECECSAGTTSPQYARTLSCRSGTVRSSTCSLFRLLLE